MEQNYQKLLTFVRDLARPKDNINRLRLLRELTDKQGDTAEEIFTNGTDYMEADIAIDARELLLTLGESYD